MTWPPIIRVFFAIEFDADTQSALQQRMVPLKKHIKPNHVRWSRPENFHVTLKFIPALNSHALPELESHIEMLIKKHNSPISLSLGNYITFPHFYRPRVIAIEVLPTDRLKAIADEITILCDTLDLTRRDNTPFRPHITIGRIKHPKEIAFDILQTCEQPPTIAVNLQHIALFRSEPKTDGSHYTVLKRFPLG